MATSHDTDPPLDPSVLDAGEVSTTPGSLSLNADDNAGESPAIQVAVQPDTPEWMRNLTVKHEDIESLVAVFYQCGYPL